jgi:hypothetical protein
VDLQEVCAWSPRYQGHDEMFLWPQIMWMVGASNRSFFLLFNLVVFSFPCTPLLSTILALTFPIYLGKQETGREREAD